MFHALLAKRRIIIFGLAAAFGVLVHALGLGAGLDGALRIARDEIRSRPASGEIHIVEIDARSLASVAKWPWPRSVHAAAVDRLHAAGARTIAFDVDFSATSDPREDAALAAALERAGGSVVLPTFQQAADSRSAASIDSVPIKTLAERSFLAAVNIAPDEDSYVREALLGVQTLGTPRPSLPVMLAEKRAEIGREFLIDYAIEPDTIPRHSFIDLIEGRVPVAQLRGKRVLIGATAIEMGDRYGVPRHGNMYGVVIQALAAETLMAGPIPRQWNGLVSLLLAFMLVAICVRPGSRARRVVLFAAGSACILALPLLTEASLALSMTLAPAIAVLSTAALLGLGSYFAGQYQQRALADVETGLPNLTALEFAADEDETVAVVVARMDRFAAIASGLGPDATTSLILRVADRLRFANGGGAIYRTDDASLAWIEQSGGEGSLEERLTAMATMMRSPVDCGRLVDVKLNFGIAPTEHADAKQAVANASLAASHAATKGSRWERFVDAGSDEINWHLSLLGELDAAMSVGQVWNAYQAKLDLKTGEIIGAEALVRWLHPQRGPIAPDGFIPLVEQNGRARDLTTHVLGQALEDAMQWDRAGYPIGVAVNVSATLLADHEFIEIIGQMLQESPLPTSRVTIEVTESAAMDSPERAIAALESWRALGINISIDDYGTGQSSLGYLQKLPATELKIDKSFVQTIGTDHRNAIMVRSTIALAHELGIKVVAEGIEDENCLALLTSIGCDTAQGFHIARPMTADQLSAFLIDRSRDAA